MPDHIERFCLWAGIGVSVFLLLASALLTANQMAVVSAAALVGLFAYAWFGLRAPPLRRYKLLAAALAAAGAAAATLVGLALSS